VTDLQPGQHGAITVTAIHRTRIAPTKYRDVAIEQADDGRWYRPGDTDRVNPLEFSKYRARTRLRGDDGRFKQLQAEGTSRAAATRALQARIAKTTAAMGTGPISSESRLDDLWDERRAELVADGRKPRTMADYDARAARILAALGGLRVREATTPVIDRYIRTVESESGPAAATQAKSVLSGMFSLAVRLGAATHNPCREARVPKSKTGEKVTPTADDLARFLADLRSSPLELPAAPGAKRATGKSIAGYCHRFDADLADLFTFIAGTGVRIGEALAVRWSDLDLAAGTVRISGTVHYVKGIGVYRQDETKTTRDRIVALPGFVTAALMARQQWAPESAGIDAVFPSQAGTWRDQDAVRKQWRRIRGPLGLDGVTPHGFRRAVATVADDANMSARMIADVLGHARPSMTLDQYMARQQTHRAVADALDARLTEPAGG